MARRPIRVAASEVDCYGGYFVELPPGGSPLLLGADGTGVFDDLPYYIQDLHYDDNQIIEIVASLSIGAFLNTWNDTMATELEEASAKTAEKELGHRSWEIGKHT